MTRRSEIEQTVARIVLGEGAAGGLPAELHAQAASDPVVGSTAGGLPVYGTHLGSALDLAGAGNEKFSNAIRRQYDRSPVKAERDLYRSFARASKEAARAHVRARSAEYAARDYQDAARVLHAHASRLRDESGRRTYDQGASTLSQLASSYEDLAMVHAEEARRRAIRGEPGVSPPAFRVDLVPGTPAQQRAQAEQILARGGRPIRVERAGRRWRLVVLGTPIGEGTKEAARHAAHQFGRYRLYLGDLAHAYVEGW